MKKIVFSMMLIMMSSFLSQGQDLITKVNGEDINAKIIEVGQTEIKYKRADNLEGPTFTIAKKDVLMVRYENGTKDIFKNERPANSASAAITNREVNSDVVSGMKYNEYKGLYNSHEYVAQPGDPYNPLIGGLCSLLIPGLGQVVAGEVGRGLCYFGATVGCSIIAGIGAGLSVYSDSATVGTLLALVGYIGCLVIDVSSIIDAVSVCKVKNMYHQDLNALALKVDFNLSPYLATVNMGVSSQPVAGMSLRVSF